MTKKYMKLILLLETTEGKRFCGQTGTFVIYFTCLGFASKIKLYWGIGLGIKLK